MAEVFFYHLTRTPLEATLPDLLEKSIGRGWSVVVRGTDDSRMTWLDEKLWTGRPESFLAHGLVGGPNDALQPILLTTGSDAPNAADILMAVDGAVVSPDEATGYARVCLLFDGNDEAAVTAARVQWKDLTDAGLPARYWSQESGNWAQKAEKNIVASA